MAANQIDESVRLSGTVARYDSKRGFGHITPVDGSENVFVFWEQIVSEDKWPRLEPGMAVEYYLGNQEDGRIAAFNVLAEGGIPLSIAGLDMRVMSEARHMGQVKFFTKAGFGFITLGEDIEWPKPLKAGQEIYVSREEITMSADSAHALHPGMDVEFNVYSPEEKADKVAAAYVTAPGGDELVFDPVLGKSNPKGLGKGNGKKGYGKDGYGMGYAVQYMPYDAWDSWGGAWDGWGAPAYGKGGGSKGKGPTVYAAPRPQAYPRPQAVPRPQVAQGAVRPPAAQATVRPHGQAPKAMPVGQVRAPRPVGLNATLQMSVVNGRTVVGPGTAAPRPLIGIPAPRLPVGAPRLPGTAAGKALPQRVVQGVQKAILKQSVMQQAPKAVAFAPAGKGGGFGFMLPSKGVKGKYG